MITETHKLNAIKPEGKRMQQVFETKYRRELQQQLLAFSAFTAVYPVSEIFAGTTNPSAKQKAQEQRCVVVCEELYALECELLRDTRTAIRELDVCYDFYRNLKPENLVKYYPPVDILVNKAIKKMAQVYKKEPILLEYYNKNVSSITCPFSAVFMEDWSFFTGDRDYGMELYRTELRELNAKFKQRGL